MIAIRDPKNQRPPTPLHRARQLVAETLLPRSGMSGPERLWSNRFWIGGWVILAIVIAGVVIWAVHG